MRMSATKLVIARDTSSTNLKVAFLSCQLPFTTASIEGSLFFGSRDRETVEPEQTRERSRSVGYIVIDGEARMVVDQSPPDAVVLTGRPSVLGAV